MNKASRFGRKEEAGGKRADVFVYQSMRSLVMILTTSSSSSTVWPVGPSNALELSLILRKVTTAQLRQRILARKRSLALWLISLLSNPTISVYIYGMTNAAGAHEECTSAFWEMRAYAFGARGGARGTR